LQVTVEINCLHISSTVYRLKKAAIQIQSREFFKIILYRTRYQGIEAEMSMCTLFLMAKTLAFIRTIQNSEEVLQFRFQKQIVFKVRMKGV